MEYLVNKIAEKEDEEGIRQLLRENPIPGRISSAFTREPDYFLGEAIGPGKTQTAVCLDKRNDRIVGLLSRRVFPAYVNGKAVAVEYMNNLRVDRAYRRQGITKRGWDFLWENDIGGGAKFCLASIIEGKNKAIEAIIRKQPGERRFRLYSRFITYVVSFLKNKKSINTKLRIKRGDEVDIKEIFDCLERNGEQRQFYPAYREDDFIGNKNGFLDFSIRDFYAAEKDGKVIGVVGVWDQSRFKQTMVKGYSMDMRLIRPFYNLGSGLFGYRSLPRVNESFKYFFVSFVAIDRDDPAVLEVLLRQIYNRYQGRDYSYFVIGLAVDDPLRPALKNFFSVKYKSRIYLIYHAEEEIRVNGLDGRPAYLETALL